MQKYGDIENYAKVKEVLTVPASYQLKIHGTNCRVGRVNGKIQVGGRNEVFWDGEKEVAQDGYGFRAFCESEGIFDLSIPEGWTFYGEFFGAKIQKGVKYLPDGERAFYVFDVRDAEGNFLDPREALLKASEVGFKTVPVVAEGILTIDEVVAIIEGNDPLAAANGFESPCEGLVIKPLRFLPDRFGRRTIAKIKSNRFTEKERTPKPPKELTPEFEAELAGRAYCTYARVENAIDKWRQTGEEVDIKNIRSLIERVRADIEKDADDIPEDASLRKAFFKGAISRVAVHFKEWEKNV